MNFSLYCPSQFDGHSRFILHPVADKMTSISKTGTSVAIRANINGNYSEEKRYGTAVVNITNHCNLNCRHCFVFREGNPNEAPVSIKDEMKDDVMLKTLEQLRERHQIR